MSRSLAIDPPSECLRRYVGGFIIRWDIPIPIAIYRLALVDILHQCVIHRLPGCCRKNRPLEANGFKFLEQKENHEMNNP